MLLLRNRARPRGAPTPMTSDKSSSLKRYGTSTPVKSALEKSSPPRLRSRSMRLSHQHWKNLHIQVRADQITVSGYTNESAPDNEMESIWAFEESAAERVAKYNVAESRCSSKWHEKFAFGRKYRETCPVASTPDRSAPTAMLDSFEQTEGSFYRSAPDRSTSSGHTQVISPTFTTSLHKADSQNHQRNSGRNNLAALQCLL